MNELLSQDRISLLYHSLSRASTVEIIFWSITILFGALFCLWIVRSILVLFLRFAGLHSPAFFARIPRAPWRSIYKIGLTIAIWWERVRRHGVRSTGGFASLLSVLSELYTPHLMLLGRAYGFGIPLLQPVGIKVTRHIKCFAMTGAGKTTGLISILSCWRGSAFVVDPKGQITSALARKDRRKWYVFDPYGISHTKSISLNFFDVIKQAIKQDGIEIAVLWAQRIAFAMISTPEGVRSPYFYDIARGFITGLILYILVSEDEENHHLPFMRTLLIQGIRIFDPKTGQEETKENEAFQLLLKAMKDCSAFDEVISGAASAVEAAGSETLGNIISTLREQTKWLDVLAIRKYLTHSDFDLADLKIKDDIVLSLVAPVSSLREELKDCFRLFINMTAYKFEITKKKKGQCLMVVDELPSLGHNPKIETILPVARSQGITFFGISQDVEILKKAYPKSWEGFIGNADAVLWMGSNHEASLAYLSKTLGRKTIIEKSPQTKHKTYREVDVATPDQLRRLLNAESGRMIATRAGQRAMMLVNEPYYNALPVWSYDSDPDHREPILRWLMRTIFFQHPKPIPQQEKKDLHENEERSNAKENSTTNTNSLEHSYDNITIFPGPRQKDR